MGGWFVFSDQLGCVYLDVNVHDEKDAMTTLETTAKTLSRYPDPNTDKTEAESIQLWKADLAPDKISHGTKTSKFMNPLKDEKGRFSELRQFSGARGGHPSTCEVVADKLRHHGRKQTGDAAGTQHNDGHVVKRHEQRVLSKA